MKSGSTKTYHQVRTTFATERGVARIEIDGDCTPRVMAPLLAGAEQSVLAARAHALVARYDTASMRISAVALLGAGTHAFNPESPLRLPTALVVAPGDLAMWRSYCGLQGQRGVLRQAFTSVVEAEAWAAEFAAIYEAQLRYRERGK